MQNYAVTVAPFPTHKIIRVSMNAHSCE